MVFSNLTFVCLFLPLVLALYHGAPQSARNLVLVIASMVFYVWGGKVAIVLVLISIGVNFMLGQSIANAAAEQRTRLIRWSVGRWCLEGIAPGGSREADQHELQEFMRAKSSA